MISFWMILAAITILCFSGLPACFLSPRSATSQRLAVLLMSLGSVVGLAGIIPLFNKTSAFVLSLPWFLPWGRFSIAVDAVSLIFLLPVFVVPVLGSIYGLEYWKPSEHPDNSRQLTAFYGLLAGSMALVIVANNAILFLTAWEIMAISAYFAATAENDRKEVCRAGWIYLVATHTGTLCLIAMFILWRYATHSFALDSAQAISPGLAGVIFVLSLIGFGFKAGIIPLHIWLPDTHANAPSHVSAVMSGVMLKMGVYGIVRMAALLEMPALWWGCITLAVGVITGVVGIIFAIGQSDIKKILAYSSIENIGIIISGLGLALLGRSLNQPQWIMLGMGGLLMHVLNHSLFKSLLFFNAGAVIHISHTRSINRMGGLAKQMPLTMLLFVIGAVAICALPPLNGFASEWLIYNGLFRTLDSGSGTAFTAAAIAAVALAMIGALAIVCFVKLLGAVFLGLPRYKPNSDAHDPPFAMKLPMILTAAGCMCIGLYPMITIKLLNSAAGSWAAMHEQTLSIAESAPLNWITIISTIFILLIGIIIIALKLLMHNKPLCSAGTWDCGYAKPTARMQYTGSSFGQILVNLFSFILVPKKHMPGIRGIFPAVDNFKITVSDVLLDCLVMPIFHAIGRYLSSFRVLQQGQTNLYILYIFITVIVLLLCGMIGV